MTPGWAIDRVCEPPAFGQVAPRGRTPAARRPLLVAVAHGAPADVVFVFRLSGRAPAIASDALPLVARTGGGSWPCSASTTSWSAGDPARPGGPDVNCNQTLTPFLRRRIRGPIGAIYSLQLTPGDWERPPVCQSRPRSCRRPAPEELRAIPQT
jgi:hypothetical protein